MELSSKIQYIEMKIKGEYPNVSIGMSSHETIDESIHIGNQNTKSCRQKIYRQLFL